jgi:hypothetical protein
MEPKRRWMRSVLAEAALMPKVQRWDRPAVSAAEVPHPAFLPVVPRGVTVRT